MSENAKRECYSSDEENFNSEDFGDFLALNDFEIGSTYWKADAIEVSHCDFLSVNSILETADERLYEEVGEVADNDYSDVSDEARAELQSLIEAWAAKHINLHYWKVRNVKECRITAEDLA